MKLKILNYTAVFQKEPEGGYTVFIPLLPGCVTYGKNLSEVKKMIQEAIKLYLENLNLHNEKIPNEDEIFYSQPNINSSQLRSTHA